ncbi:hypothetical protein ACLB2K_023023 [Fragaria x ananassa]
MNLPFSLFLGVVYLFFGCFIFPTVLGSVSRSLALFLALWVLIVPEHPVFGSFYFHRLFHYGLSSAMVGGPLWSDSFESNQSQSVPLFFGGDRTVDYLSRTDTHLSEISPTPLSRPIHSGCGNLGSSFMAGLICYGEPDVCINIWKSDGWIFWTCMGLSAMPLIWLDQINSLLRARGGAMVFSLLSDVAVVWFYFVVCLFEAFEPCISGGLWTSVYIFNLNKMCCSL